MTVPDHICSAACIFCRILDNPQRHKVAHVRARLDNQVLDRVRELEQRSMLDDTRANLAGAKSDELEQLALIDSLTELYNQRTLLKELQEELQRAKRYKRAVTLCMVSVDRFKDISKQYGPLTTDAILKIVANALRQCVRDVDIPARYGIEEFAVVLPETTAAGAAKVAERIRENVATQSVTHNWQNLRLTVSMGLASFPTHAKTQDELISSAMQALGMSITKGGDQVSIA